MTKRRHHYVYFGGAIIKYFQLKESHHNYLHTLGVYVQHVDIAN